MRPTLKRFVDAVSKPVEIDPEEAARRAEADEQRKWRAFAMHLGWEHVFGDGEGEPPTHFEHADHGSCRLGTTIDPYKKACHLSLGEPPEDVLAARDAFIAGQDKEEASFIRKAMEARRKRSGERGRESSAGSKPELEAMVETEAALKEAFLKAIASGNTSTLAKALSGVAAEKGKSTSKLSSGPTSYGGLLPTELLHVEREEPEPDDDDDDDDDTPASGGADDDGPSPLHESKPETNWDALE